MNRFNLIYRIRKISEMIQLEEENEEKEKEKSISFFFFFFFFSLLQSLSQAFSSLFPPGDGSHSFHSAGAPSPDIASSCRCGARGGRASFHPSCSSDWLPLLELQREHAVTRLLQSLRPPVLRGMMWSIWRWWWWWWCFRGEGGERKVEGEKKRGKEKRRRTGSGGVNKKTLICDPNFISPSVSRAP